MKVLFRTTKVRQVMLNLLENILKRIMLLKLRKNEKSFKDMEMSSMGKLENARKKSKL